MLTWLRARSRSGRTAAELYGSIVTAARREIFYSELGIPDTPDGRFAMLALHMYLVLERLREEGPAGQELSRALVERFVTDMDDCMRELGVGDLTVPRKVKKAAGALYDWSAQFRKAKAAGDERALAEAVKRCLLPSEADSREPKVLATYICKEERRFREHPATALLPGKIAFGAVVLEPEFTDADRA